MEGMCEILWEEICTKRNQWVMHKCSVRGCAEGYVTIDGNEKLRRPMCAAPRRKLQIRRDLPTVVQCCTNYPITGGKHQEARRFCHLHLDDENLYKFTESMKLFQESCLFY